MKLTLYLCLRISEAIHGKTNGDMKPRRKLENPAQPHMVRGSSFLSPQATELRTGIREKNQQRRKPQPHASADRERPLGACCISLKGLHRQVGLLIRGSSADG